MSGPLVSVIIPTYNRAPRVTAAARSALAQTHGEVEVIVVDDGSTDGTADTLKRMIDDPRLRVIRRDNGGPSAARNTGIDAATGDLVAFLDSDDEWLPWKLAFQIECLESAPGTGMTWSDLAAVDADGLEIADRYIRTFYVRYADLDLDRLLPGRVEVAGPDGGSVTLRVGDAYPAMFGGNIVHTSTVLMTRQRLEAVGAFDESLVPTGEDYDFHLRTCAQGEVVFADVPTIRYRVGAPDQLTRPDLHVSLARNALTTVEKALAVAADDPRITPATRRRAMAMAACWLGEELVDAGRGREARPHLVRSFRVRPRFRVAAFWIMSWLPARATGAIRRYWGRFRRRGR